MALMMDSCEGILLSLDSHKSVPAPFLTKTYQLVDDPATDHIVSWGEDDATFVVWRPPEFARDLLPNYFKHNNFSSFVRQLNTYGFRKIVPDRWEFANEFFKKGEKHLLCEIHRRKTSQPQVALNHQNHHHHHHSQGYFPYPSRVSISPPDSDEQLWGDSPPPLSSPTGGVSVLSHAASNGYNYNYNNNSNNGGGGAAATFTALSEDNERLRRSNTVLASELAHMRKLYNDMIYFVQNHVKPAAPPSNSYHSSLFISNTSRSTPNAALIGYPSNTKGANPKSFAAINASSSPSKSGVTILEEAPPCLPTKLFGVALHSKKRLHPEYNSAVEINNKTRLVLEKDDLGFHLMPPSPC